MSDQQPPLSEAQPAKPVQPVLAYRAVRWMWRVGRAPGVIDFLMIIATAILLFAATWMVILPLVFEAPLWLLAIAAGLILSAGGLWYWSNHFRHRQPVSVEEMTDEERQSLQ